MLGLFILLLVGLEDEEDGGIIGKPNGIELLLGLILLLLLGLMLGLLLGLMFELLLGLLLFV